MSELRPAGWLWGLVPLTFIAALVLIGFAPQIEADLQRRTDGALKQADLGWVSATFKGRDVTLRGEAMGADARDAALDVVGRIWGVREIEDQITLLESASPYTWWANRKEGRIRIKGYVPDGRDRHTILGIVKALMPELVIDDRMKRAGGAPPREMWVGSISFALNLLAQLKEGTASLTDSKLSLTGEASSVEAYDVLRNRLKTQLPAGLELDQVEVTPPVAKPFSWVALFEAGSLTLSGSVPSEDARLEIEKNAKEMFGTATVVDRMKLAAGAPEKWTQVVTTALTQLSRLQSGKAELNDTTLAFEGSAPNEETANDVANKVRLGLPAVYKSTEDVGYKTRPVLPKTKRGLKLDEEQQEQRANGAGGGSKKPDQDAAAPI